MWWLIQNPGQERSILIYNSNFQPEDKLIYINAAKKRIHDCFSFDDASIPKSHSLWRTNGYRLSCDNLRIGPWQLHVLYASCDRKWRSLCQLCPMSMKHMQYYHLTAASALRLHFKLLRSRRPCSKFLASIDPTPHATFNFQCLEAWIKLKGERALLMLSLWDSYMYSGSSWPISLLLILANSSHKPA